MRNFKILSVLLYVAGAINLNAQKPISRQPESLDRGIVAVRTDPNSVFISWRLLATDPEGIGFNLYRGERKLNKKPLTETTCYTDSVTSDEIYKVKSVIKGREQGESSSCMVWKDGFLRIPLNRPPGGEMEREYIPPDRRQGQTQPRANANNSTLPVRMSQTQNRRQYSYSPGDAGAGDLDGDGQYEIVLKWDPSNARDNAQDGFTGNVILDAYEVDGRQLWRINLGTNIRAGAHYTQFLVFDFDGDGKAEVVCKTADGTVDGKGKIIGDRDADYVNERGRILTGPEYLTVFNGLTGEAMQTVDYVPGRGNVCGWGANECNGNRVDRFLACVAYLDGKQPSLVMCRGYYGRTTLAAWDWRNGKLTMRWLFDSDKGFPEFMGQGNHNLSVADVDDDGRDEIIYGSCAFDDDGTPIYTTRMGHGDAMHLSDLDPDIPGLEVWAVKETGGWGSVMHSAADGKILLRIPDSTDVGRGLAADIYPNHRGYELWSSRTGGIYNVKGEKITSSLPPVNFRIYWDGDLQDELLDRSYIDDWDYINHKPVRLLDASKYGGVSINGTKATPVLSADLLGDWREEVIFRSTDNNSLLLFTTGIPTQYRMPTLMHDPVYRLGVAWQNVVYNQPPHTGFFMGDVIKKK
ncbi:MAG TPA: rhamnogalacturonan lyase [Bacteroidales bacterium]|nr:rhamnogalacturonan lyase [Bacteroidales bacterium]HRR92427.1 rhamnogalacturonan lyase [Bacteroidales bacterium]